MPIETNAVVAALLLSVLPPVVFVGIRQAVKINRQEVVRDLAAVFSKSSTDKDDLIPSFEFVKYKYFFQRAGETEAQRPKDHSAFSWVLGAIPLVILLFFLCYLVASMIGSVVLAELATSPASAKPAEAGASRPLWIWCLCAAFAGGYVFMIRSFYRAINNFDLSPMSFAGACNNLFVGIVGAMILPYAVISSVTPTGMPILQSGATVAAIILSFAIGYLPESATRTILARSDLGYWKRENDAIYKSSLTTPLEIIDGIDTEIRDRLGDFHIRSPQNLAATNPLMLFVETPFGVYQIMDWVAQAQLCCSVGPVALPKLWALGVRTLFDLERVALDCECYDPPLLQKVGRILLGDATESGGAAGAGTAIEENTIVSDIVIRLDDPHVHRLRQIYIRIGERLGPSNRRFSSSTRPRKPCVRLALAPQDGVGK